MSHCVVLNADYSFLNIVDWKRAMCLIVKGKVEVLRYSESVVQGVAGYIAHVPALIRLVRLVRTVYRAQVPFSKRNVLVRDGHQCAYCGSRVRKLTMDHIQPCSRGGRSSFDNCVACCRPCNNHKANRTPHEAGLRLRLRPHHPSLREVTRLRLSRLDIEAIWETLMA